MRANLVDLVAREGCVRCHEEVTSWCGDEGRDDPNEIIVHVARVSEGLGAGRHYSRDLVSCLVTLLSTP